MNEQRSLEELKQEAENKKDIYMSLLKQHNALYELHRKEMCAGWMLCGGIALPVIGLFVGLFSLALIIGIIIAIASFVIFARFNSRFETLFEETASPELKQAREEYKECNSKLADAEKASKEERIAKEKTQLHKDLQELQTSKSDDYEYNKDNVQWEKEAEKMFRKIHDREMVSPHYIYTSDLSDTINKNKLIVQSFVDKTILLTGQILNIDYDKERQIPYILIGTGHYYSSTNTCDEYACYFSHSSQFDTLASLEVGDIITVFGIFSKTEYNIPSAYILLDSRIMDIHRQ